MGRDVLYLAFARQVWDKLMDVEGGWIDVSNDGLDNECIRRYQLILAQEMYDLATRVRKESEKEWMQQNKPDA